MSAWESLIERMREIQTLHQVAGLLEWDQQTFMPSGGSVIRGQHTALMSALSHQRLVAPEVGEWLDTLGASDDLDGVQQAAVRNISRR
ncbi:MAG: carboxypeptidase M32, partial [Myxococcota bacterium]